MMRFNRSPCTPEARDSHRVMPLAIALALALSACGSSQPSSGPGTSAPSGGGLTAVGYADCMRSHGVPSFPDSSPGGGITLSPGINPSAPAFRSAAAACASLLPAPLAHRKPTAQQRRLALVFSKCVRAHGFPRFPDPTPVVPTPGVVAGQGLVRGGLYWRLPAGAFDTTGFSAAARACGLDLTGAKTAAP